MNTVEYNVLCCGFSPCVQRIVEFSSFEKGAVNRAVRTTIGVGGKGANVARMIRGLGEDPLLLGFAGGANGRMLERMLDAEGVRCFHVETVGETRICQTLSATNDPEPTELVEEMPAVRAGEWERMLERLSEVMNRDVEWVAMAGKLPAGLPADAYARVAEMAADRKAEVVIDASGEALIAALKFRPLLAKMNAEELALTLGTDDPVAGAEELLARGARSVLITRGAKSAFYVDAAGTSEWFPPRIEAVNPVGSGDAVTAGFVTASLRGAPVEEALRFGMACGAANALERVSGRFDLSDAERLRDEVRIERRDGA